jgi:hypothetical protein
MEHPLIHKYDQNIAQLPSPATTVTEASKKALERSLAERL